MKTYKEIFADCVADKVCTVCHHSYLDSHEYPCRDCVGTVEHESFKAIVPDDIKICTHCGAVTRPPTVEEAMEILKAAVQREAR